VKRPPVVGLEGRPTGAAITRFTEGDCWLLAFELGRMADLPLVALVIPYDHADWCHVAADLGRETLLDVLGPRSRDETMRFWVERVGEPLVYRELGRFHTLDEYLRTLDAMVLETFVSQMDEEDARTVARALYDRHVSTTPVRTA
jgi:hypothetical protein